MNDDVALPAGAVLRLRTTGGGGWGDPFEREPELVLQDVARGLVSEEAAELDYGVVIRDGEVKGLRRERRGGPLFCPGPRHAGGCRRSGRTARWVFYNAPRR